MAVQLIPTVTTFEGKEYKAYSLNNQLISPAPVIQRISLITGEIGGGQEKRISLAELECAILVKSCWVFKTGGDVDSFTFRIYDQGIEVMKYYLQSSKVPYEFPEAILLPSYEIGITPSQEINNCVLYAEPVDILHSIDVSD